MATVTVSGRVDEGTKRLADLYIRKHGTTQAEVISSVWHYIADTGELPVKVASHDRKTNLMETFTKLRSQTPKGTPLSTMDAKALKIELANRE